MADPTCDTGWFTSSHSDASSNNCVECRIVADEGVLVRDSKNPGQASFRIAPDAWTAFLGGVGVDGVVRSR